MDIKHASPNPKSKFIKLILMNIPIIRNGLTHANVVTVTRTGKWLKQIFEFLLCSEIHFIHHSITPFHFFPILLAFLVSPLAYRAFVCSVRIPAWG